jgi:Ras family
MIDTDTRKCCALWVDSLLAAAGKIRSTGPTTILLIPFAWRRLLSLLVCCRGAIMPNSNMSRGDLALVHCKVAILDFRAVGKSSLTNAFVSGTFSEQYDPTIEATHHITIRFRKVHFATDIVNTAGMD